MNLLWVGLGGCLGSILRYLTVNAAGRLFPSEFPYGTLIVNVIGCFIIAFIGGLAEGKMFLSAEARLLVFVGILGGFTTFSAFGYETFYFLKTSQFSLAFLNITAQLLLGLGAVALGYWASRIFA